MTDPERIGRIADVLREAGPAHHQAYQATDGDDPEWPLWYAGFLLAPLRSLLRPDLTKSELTYLLVRAEKERSTRQASADWPTFYAESFLADPPPGRG